MFNNLPKLEENVAEETKMALVHVAGYVTRNGDVTDDDLFEVDMKYYRKYRAFTQSIDRGGMNVYRRILLANELFTHSLCSMLLRTEFVALLCQNYS